MVKPGEHAFFLSYAREDGDDCLEQFFDDLARAVRRLTAWPNQAVGFRDLSGIAPGAQWREELERALSSSRAFLSLYSPSYFTSEFCGREWSAFRSRLEAHARSEGELVPPLIIPVLWVPLRIPSDKLPGHLREIQWDSAELGRTYAREGLRYLVDVDNRRGEYKEFLNGFSRKLVDAIERYPLPAAHPVLRLDDFRSAFDEGPLRRPPRTRKVQTGTLRRRPHRDTAAEETDFETSRPGIREDLLSLIETICRLREPGAQIERMRASWGGGDFLRVSVLQDEIARVYPIAAVEDDITPEALHAFLRDVDARYRRNDTGVISVLVYGGGPAPEDLVREARNRRVRLVSLDEYRGLIDFRAYVARQTERLAADSIYPPELYVDQRMTFDVGRGEEETANAMDTISDWLASPNGRFVLVLGDFGTGKTFLLHEMARRMGETGTGLIPILLQMRSLEKGRSLDELLAQHFVREGMEDFSPRKLRFMLEQGRIALLFDGFDELALRVTYPRATEHFDTLLQAAVGAAKVVVTSRRQHFLTDSQVMSALGEKVEALTGRRIAILQPFDPDQIRAFLVRYCGGDETRAKARLRLIERVKDLMGLSQNPRMLGFIADLPEKDLEKAGAGQGEITSAVLYRLILDRWLQDEARRIQPKGAPPGLTGEHRLKAVTALALRLWQKTESFASLAELEEEAARVLQTLSASSLDSAAAAFQVGSGTLLVRDEEGSFSFLHQSILEWLVAREIAEELSSGAAAKLLSVRELSPLMADFLIGLVGRTRLLLGIQRTLASAAGGMAKKNALLLAQRTALAHGPEPALSPNATLAGQDLRGKDLSKQDLSGADLTDADLTDATLVRSLLKSARLKNASLAGSDLLEADLSEADLSGANLTGARLTGTDLRKANLAGAVLSRAKLIGARWDEHALQGAETFGAALEVDASVTAFVMSAGACRVVTWHPGGDLLASADGLLARIWDVRTSRELRRFQGHTGSVRSLGLSHDGRILVTSGEDGTIRLWEGETGREISRFLEPNVGVASLLGGGEILAVGTGQIARFLEAGTGRELARFEGHDGAILCLGLSPDGRTLATGGQDRTVRLWDIDTGKELLRLKGHDGGVLSLAFSPDGTSLLTGSEDRTLRLWEVRVERAREGRSLPADGRPTRHSSFLGEEELWSRTLGGRVWSVAFNPDGGLMACGCDDRIVHLWKLVKSTWGESFGKHEASIRSVAFSPENRFLASGSSDRTVRLWELQGGQEVRRLEARDSAVRSVAFSPNGRLLASGSAETSIRLWQVSTGRELRRLEGHKAGVGSVGFSPDGQMLATGSDDQTVRLWRVRNPRQLLRIESPGGRVRSLEFSPDGRTLASGSEDRTLHLWDVATGKSRLRISGHGGGVYGVQFSRDGNFLASGSSDRRVRLWETKTGQRLQLFRGHKDTVHSVAFAPDGRTLASGAADGSVILWDVEAGRELLKLEGHGGEVRTVAFSPDGASLASGSSNGTVRLWEAGSGRELRRLEGHDGGIGSVAFSPAGRYLASGSDDNTIRLWDVSTGRCLAILGLLPEGWVAFAPDGRYKFGGIPAGGFWHVIGLCRFEAGELDDSIPGLRLGIDASFLDLPPWKASVSG